jgi:hypothetical protein
MKTGRPRNTASRFPASDGDTRCRLLLMRLRTKQRRPHSPCRPINETPWRRTKQGRPRHSAALTILDQHMSCWRRWSPLRRRPAVCSRRWDFRSNPLATLLINLVPTQSAISKISMYRERASCLRGIHVSTTQPQWTKTSPDQQVCVPWYHVLQVCVWNCT